MTPEQNAFCLELVAARKNRETARLLSLMDQSETLLRIRSAPARVIDDAYELGEFAGRPVAIRILELGRDVVELADLDDLALYRYFAALGTDLTLIFREEPRAWDEFNRRVARTLEIASLTERVPVILRPGIAIDRSDTIEWLRKEIDQPRLALRAPFDLYRIAAHALAHANLNLVFVVDQVPPIVRSALAEAGVMEGTAENGLVILRSGNNFIVTASASRRLRAPATWRVEAWKMVDGEAEEIPRSQLRVEPGEIIFLKVSSGG